eukprot:scaffold3792_cov160-Skeletonema_menzelii.AAC.1
MASILRRTENVALQFFFWCQSNTSSFDWRLGRPHESSPILSHHITSHHTIVEKEHPRPPSNQQLFHPIKILGIMARKKNNKNNGGGSSKKKVATDAPAADARSKTSQVEKAKHLSAVRSTVQSSKLPRS